MSGAGGRAAVVVTGGTGALGRAVVGAFAGDGATVHVPWLAEAEMGALERELGTEARQVRLRRCDVTSERDVRELFAAVAADGGTAILANIVGGFAAAPIEETDPALWERMLRLNLTSAFLCTRAAVPAMKARRWGRIVNVSSAPAINRGAANLGAYAAAKAAVLNLSESLAKELGPWGITVNALVPSVIDTAANRAANPEADTTTWLKPAEIAQVVRFLASEAAGIVTGTAVNLSRG